MFKKLKKRYFARAILHTAGQSNQIGINKGLVSLGIGLGGIITTTLLILLYITFTAFGFVVFTVPALFVFLVLSFVLVQRGDNYVNLYWQGKEGERYVRDELECLIKKDYEIINDVPGNKFNVDFILIGPSGVYVIEVKNPRKTKDDKIVYQDGVLYVGPKDMDSKRDAFKKFRRALNKPDPLAQVRMTTNWVRRLLESNGRKNVESIKPVVLFPNFWVENYLGDTWVMNSKSFALEIPHRAGVLTAQEISELTAIVRAHIQATIMSEED